MVRCTGPDFGSPAVPSYGLDDALEECDLGWKSETDFVGANSWRLTAVLLCQEPDDLSRSFQVCDSFFPPKIAILFLFFFNEL